MMNSIFGTVDIVAAPATSRDVGAFYAAPESVPMRVMVRNIGVNEIVLGLSPASVTGAASSNPGSYRLPAGDESVFVLAPKQSLFAVGVGAGGRLSFAASEALPMDLTRKV